MRRNAMSAAAASMRITLSTQIAQANIVIMRSSVRPPESLGKALLPKALPMRHRSIREGASEIPLRGSFVIGAGSSEAQLPTGVIRDRIMTYKSPWMTDETRIFQKTVCQFIEIELAPHQARWAEQGHPDAEAWIKAGKMGLLLPDVPEEYGGGGGTFAHEAIIIEELARSG